MRRLHCLCRGFDGASGTPCHGFCPTPNGGSVASKATQRVSRLLPWQPIGRELLDWSATNSPSLLLGSPGRSLPSRRRSLLCVGCSSCSALFGSLPLLEFGFPLALGTFCNLFG